MDPVPRFTVSLEETGGPASWSEVSAPPPAPRDGLTAGGWRSLDGPDGVLAQVWLTPRPGGDGSGPGPPGVAG